MNTKIFYNKIRKIDILLIVLYEVKFNRFGFIIFQKEINPFRTAEKVQA